MVYCVYIYPLQYVVFVFHPYLPHLQYWLISPFCFIHQNRRKSCCRWRCWFDPFSHISCFRHIQYNHQIHSVCCKYTRTEPWIIGQNPVFCPIIDGSVLLVVYCVYTHFTVFFCFSHIRRIYSIGWIRGKCWFYPTFPYQLFSPYSIL